RLGIQEERCIAVGNSHFDAPMLEKAGFGIAFNPSDNNVRKAADFVIEEKDLSLLPKRADL
ncbi:MAG: HAD hydrolase family protein, partial [Candidatus Aenigmatarchaeota archaeon]